MPYLHKTGFSASNSTVWSLSCPLVITFVLACGLVEAGPALAFVALLLTEAALQEWGEAMKLAFHNFAKCTTTSCHSYKYPYLKRVFTRITEHMRNSFKNMLAGFFENKLEYRSLFESSSVLIDLQASSFQCFSCFRKLLLRISERKWKNVRKMHANATWNPGRQVQLKDVLRSVQRPPFLHGLDSHSFTSASHLTSTRFRKRGIWEGTDGGIGRNQEEVGVGAGGGRFLDRRQGRGRVGVGIGKAGGKGVGMGGGGGLKGTGGGRVSF
jgi:hypothetical protein